MADLTIAPATGDQVTTQNPQTVPKPTVGASTQSGGIQPGTPKDVLNSVNGVSLHSTPLTVVNLSTATATVSDPPSQPVTKPAKHHVNPGILIVSVLLVVIAIALVAAIARSAKNTTD